MKNSAITAFKEGEGFYKASKGALTRPEVFTPLISYNILAMAAEKYCMSLCYLQGCLPDNHTFHDFADTLSEFFETKKGDDFTDRVRSLDKPQAALCANLLSRAILSLILPS